MSASAAAGNPKTIAVNITHTHAFSDGLSAGEWEQLSRALPPGYLPRVVRAEGLALDYIASHRDVWLTRRIDIARHWAATHPA